ncbi:MAG: hypothetical protein ACAH59_04990 [Pseudobdellovibrionaceae bacterium]
MNSRLFVFLILFFSIQGWAEEPKAPLRFELIGGLNVTSFDYKEDVPYPLKSEEKGTFVIPSLRGRIFIPQLNESFFNAEAEYSGQVQSNYDGTTLQGVPVTHTNDHIFYRIETDFYFRVQEFLYLYAGIGYRYWDRFLSGGTGFREIYTWTYFPLGFLIEVPVSDALDIGFDFSSRLMSNGKIEVIFSETVTDGDDTTLDLGNKPGFKLQVPFRLQRKDSAYRFLISPWYEYSQIGESSFEFNSTPGVQTDIREPDSTTQQYGLLLGVGLLL